MHRFRKASQQAVALALLALSACVAPPPPIVSLEGRDCTREPNLATAASLSLDPNKALTVKLDGSAACLQTGEGSRSAYAIFQLPQSTDEYVVAVASAPLGRGLFSPHLLMLDANGSVLRELPRDSFLFHGPSLSAGIRARPAERYLIVASDPETVGRNVSQLAGNTQVTAGSSGLVYFQIHTGSETTNTYTYAHNGTVTVFAHPLPKVN
jgi:hypothetical protein